MEQNERIFYLHPMGEVLDSKMLDACKIVKENHIEELIKWIAPMIPEVSIDEGLDMVFSMMERYRHQNKELYDLFLDLVNATNGTQMLSLGLELLLLKQSEETVNLKKIEELEQQYSSMYEMNNIMHMCKANIGA